MATVPTRQPKWWVLSLQTPQSDEVVEERDRRIRLWRDLTTRFIQDRIPAEDLHITRAFRGQRGIWVDASRTRRVTHEKVGVTVSVLHTGAHYPDDLRPDGLSYHYPETSQVSKDQMEVAATKLVKRLDLPLFVVTAGVTQSVRWLRRARVEGWDDSRRIFDLRFTT